MRQLLQSCVLRMDVSPEEDDSLSSGKSLIVALVVALNEKAFLLLMRLQDDEEGVASKVSRPFCVQQLDAPSTPQSTDTSVGTQALHHENHSAVEVQAVGIMQEIDANTVWIAVTRYNKSLAIYKLPIDQFRSLFWKESETSSDVFKPVIVHQTTKRAGCLCFASVGTFSMIIAGDLTGDAVAYSLDSTHTPPSSSKSLQKQLSSRHLLGHTASMLTGIVLVSSPISSSDSSTCRQQYILTADRDEKIRISRFPQTFIVEGYLLGHTAFVSCIDVDNIKGSNYCVSCGGDATIRLWKLMLPKGPDGKRFSSKVSVVDTRASIGATPTRVAISGSWVAAIFHESNVVALYQWKEQVDGHLSLNLVSQLNCLRQPLAVDTFMLEASIRVTVLTREPDLLEEFQVDQERCRLVKVANTSAFQKELQGMVGDNFVMPQSVWEHDKHGNVKLAKTVEDRTKEVPWTKVERIEKHRKARQRKKRRRRGGGDRGAQGVDDDDDDDEADAQVNEG